MIITSNVIYYCPVVCVILVQLFSVRAVKRPSHCRRDAKATVVGYGTKSAMYLSQHHCHYLNEAYNFWIKRVDITLIKELTSGTYGI